MTANRWPEAPVEALFAALEASTWATALSGSLWVYPLINAGHLLGIALLVGAIVPMDLRLLGAWPSVPLASLCRVLGDCAAAGLLLATVCGALLFATRATEYAAAELFVAKMMVVALATLNALALRLRGLDACLRAADAGHALPRRVRAAAAVSLLAWPTALILGRMLGYR